MQPDAVGNRLKEVQQKSQDLAHFGILSIHIGAFHGTSLFGLCP